MKRPTLALALAALALLALPAAAGAASPWWQVLTGSRPTNLPPAPDQSETQRLTTSSFENEGQEVFVARLQVGGETVGCLGSGELLLSPFPPLSADQLCESEVGFPATETPAALAELLEGEEVYGGEVQVSGPADIGEGSFEIETPGRWVPNPVQLSPITYKPPVGAIEFALGSASSQITSEGSGRLVVIADQPRRRPPGRDRNPAHDHRLAAPRPRRLQRRRLRRLDGNAGPVECAVKSLSLVRCGFDDELPSYEAIEVEIAVAATAAPAGAGTVTVSGGKAPRRRRPGRERRPGSERQLGPGALRHRTLLRPRRRRGRRARPPRPASTPSSGPTPSSSTPGG